jgi:hypothetical protein
VNVDRERDSDEHRRNVRARHAGATEAVSSVVTSSAETKKPAGTISSTWQRGWNDDYDYRATDPRIARRKAATWGQQQNGNRVRSSFIHWPL